jgi:uncharacterized protein
MRFEWDDEKRRSNIAKHGIDFVTASQAFDGRPHLDYESPRRGEERVLRIATVEGRLIAVAWTPRQAAVRIISARRARHEEARAYRQLHR